MPKKSWIIPLGLILGLALLFVPATSSVWSQSNVARVTITDEGIEAEATEGEHPLVTAHVSVLDDEGCQVSGLERDDFSVKEWPNPISEFEVSEERQGVAVALLADVSGSMKYQGLSDTRLQDVQETVEQFVGSLREGDMVAIFTFCKEVNRVQPLTAYQEGMDSKVIQAITIPTGEAGQFTFLFDAMYDAIGELTSGEKELGPEFARMKKAIFVFSDGKDEGSLHDLFDIKRKLLAEDPKGKISVYAVGVGSEKDETYPADFRHLINLADVTKGRFIHYFGESEQEAPAARRELRQPFDHFLSQRMQYVIRYSTEACADIVTLSVEIGGQADEEEVKIPPVPPIIRLSGVEEGQTVSGALSLKTESLLAQCAIREVTYFVNGVKMVTLAPPFTWEWDTSTLPDNPNCGAVEVDTQGNGLIEDVVVRVEAIDQEGYSATDEVSSFMVQLPSPKVEILGPIDNEFIERWGTWRTKCEDTAPTELSVKIQVTQSGQRREIGQVEYYLNGQSAGSLQTVSDQYTVDIPTLGCNSVDEETQHTVKVRVVGELGRFAEAEVSLAVKVHVETFWEMLIRIAPKDFPTLVSVLSMALALAVLVVFLRSPQRTIEVAAGGIRRLTKILGVASKGTRLVLIENGEDGKSYAVLDVMSLGADQGLDITFDHPRVSGLHAKLAKVDEEFVIYDQGSKNGTWVNEQRLRFQGSQVLENGDIIGLGPIRLRFEREGESKPEVEIEEE